MHMSDDGVPGQQPARIRGVAVGSQNHDVENHRKIRHLAVPGQAQASGLGGQVVRWLGGQVARWSGGQVIRWPGGQVIRWPDGQVIKCSFGEVIRWSHKKLQMK